MNNTDSISIFGDGSEGDLVVTSLNYFYIPLMISDLKSGKTGYLSEEDPKIIWNDGLVTNLSSCKDCGKPLSGPHCFDKPNEICKVRPAICTKCNYINEYQQEDPNYICYKCKNF